MLCQQSVFASFLEKIFWMHAVKTKGFALVAKLMLTGVEP